jgi:hypothetical protein
MNARQDVLPKPPTPPATATINGHVNCNSCHRAHGAMDKGGYYILHQVEGENKDVKAIHPVIDYTTLCLLCHVGK